MTRLYLINSNKKKSQDVDVSFEDKHDENAAGVKKEEHPMPKAPEITVQISAEEMKKKQAKKDEDPKITKFKNAEVN